MDLSILSLHQYKIWGHIKLVGWIRWRSMSLHTVEGKVLKTKKLHIQTGSILSQQNYLENTQTKKSGLNVWILTTTDLFPLNQKLQEQEIKVYSSQIKSKKFGD